MDRREILEVRQLKTNHLIIDTTFGRWKTTVSGGSVRDLSFPRRAPRAGRFKFRGRVAGEAEAVARFLRRFFDAKIRNPGKLPADVAGTDFQKRVWRQIAQIPFGRTRSYRAIARRLGMPRAARAVGNACGANPLPLLVPCHRVVAEGGKIGGFSGGLAWKKWLLNFEAAEGKNGDSHVHQRQTHRRSVRRPTRPA